MEFDNRALVDCKSIVQRPRIVGESARVDDDASSAIAGRVNGVDQVALVVALHMF